MFTGIIEATGTIRSIEEKGADKRLVVDTGKLDLSDVSPGDSICVNGVCVTVIELLESGFATDVSTETLSCTTFAGLRPGSRVNLEKAMQLTDRLGGHIVSGHVDGVGRVVSMHDDGRSTRYDIEAPVELARYICKKGSVCVDGVSLTVNELKKNHFGVNIIPHTRQETIFADYRENTPVNLEVDVIARYLERLHNSS